MNLANVTGERDTKIFFKFFGMSAFLLVMGLIIAGLHSQMKSGFGEVLLWLIILSLAVYMVWLFYKTVPRIYLDAKYLQYNSKKYYWAELETIAFTGKWRAAWESNQEGLMLKFKGCNEVYIFDDTFSNISDVKRFIKENIIERVPEAVKPSEVEPLGRIDKLQTQNNRACQANETVQTLPVSETSNLDKES